MQKTDKSLKSTLEYRGLDDWNRLGGIVCYASTKRTKQPQQLTPVSVANDSGPFMFVLWRQALLYAKAPCTLTVDT